MLINTQKGILKELKIWFNKYMTPLFFGLGMVLLSISLGALLITAATTNSTFFWIAHALTLVSGALLATIACVRAYNEEQRIEKERNIQQKRGNDIFTQWQIDHGEKVNGD